MPPTEQRNDVLHSVSSLRCFDRGQWEDGLFKKQGRHYWALVSTERILAIFSSHKITVLIIMHVPQNLEKRSRPLSWKKKVFFICTTSASYNFCLPALPYLLIVIYECSPFSLLILFTPNQSRQVAAPHWAGLCRFSVIRVMVIESIKCSKWKELDFFGVVKIFHLSSKLKIHLKTDVES